MTPNEQHMFDELGEQALVAILERNKADDTATAFYQLGLLHGLERGMQLLDFNQAREFGLNLRAKHPLTATPDPANDVAPAESEDAR